MTQTIHVKVKFYGRLRAFEKNIEILELHRGATLKDLFYRLAKKYDAFEGHFITNKGDISRSLLIVVDGKPIDFEKDINMELKDGSWIAAMVPVAGG